MGNVLYTKAKQSFLKAEINWETDDIRAILIDAADYTVNLSTDQYLSIIPSGARVSVTSVSGRTATDGVADASDATFTSVSGDVSEAVVLYQHTGTESTSRLIAYLDSATGLPVTPTGANITVVWDNGTNKIFRLT